jgi:hypothetical protein
MGKLSVVLLICAIGCFPLIVAGQSPGSFPYEPLARSSAVPCSQRNGIRAARSDLVQLGQLTASITSQAMRENGICIQTAALWLNQKDISQQVDLPDAASKTFAIVDIAPDGSSVLLSAAPLFPANHPYQLAVVPLNAAAVKWISIADLVGFAHCDANLTPQGFLDLHHLIVAVAPQPTRRNSPSCQAIPAQYSVDLVTRRAEILPDSTTLHRFARSVSGPVQSCKADPDVIGACYTARARLGLASNGSDLLLWRFGGDRYMGVEEGMIPTSLSSQLTPTTRILATMVICPIMPGRPDPKAYVCIDSAYSFRLETIPHPTTRSFR